MIPQEIFQKLTERFPGEKIERGEGAKHPVTGQKTGDDFFTISAEKVKEILRFLKENLSFDCLSNLTAVDRKDLFEVVYHLFSYKNRYAIALKVALPRDDNAHLQTVEDLWGCANWLEREIFDLFGIRFDGHSDLRRIMLPDDWVGYPLRKDYKEEEDYHGISTTRPALIQEVPLPKLSFG